MNEEQTPSNPYQTPEAELIDAPEDSGEDLPLLPPQRQPAGHGWTWLTAAWALMRRDLGPWVGATAAYFVIIILVQQLPVIGLASYVITPLFMGGLMLGAHAGATGSGFKFDALFEGFGEHRRELMMLGLWYLGLVIVIVLIGVALALLLIGAGTGMELWDKVENNSLSGTPGETAALLSVVMIVLVMFGLFLPLLMAQWFSPALIVFHQVDALTAMKQSLKACLTNFIPLSVNGLIIMLLGIFATLPLFLGWLLLGPLITASIYTAYREIFTGQAFEPTARG